MAETEIAQAANLNKEALRSLDSQVTSTAGEMMNMRAAFLFTAFSMMAIGQMVSMVTEKFQNMQQSMTDAYSEIEYQAAAASTVMTGNAEAVSSNMERMLELGRKTEYTAVEAGEALEVLARAGMSVKESHAAAGPVLEMARANGMAVGETARFAAGMYEGWGLETSAMNDILEENVNYISETDAVMQNLTMSMASITHAARQSRMRAEELAQAMKFATATARTVGWEMEEVAAGMMVAADNMIEAGMAGRSFRRVMSRIGIVAGETGRGIDQARDLMDKYGIQLKDSNGEMIGFIELIEELEEKTKELTGTQRINLMQQLAGMRGMNALSANLEKGSEKLKQNRWELKASAAAAGLAEAGYKDVRGQMERMREELVNNHDNLETLTMDHQEFAEENGVTLEVAQKLDDVLTDTSLTTKQFKDELENITIVSEMVDARLDTLNGSMILLESSIEAMWASLAEGLYKELMQAWYEGLRKVTDAISTWSEKSRAAIAVTITYFSAIGRVVPALMNFFGLLMVTRAAMAANRLEQMKQNETVAKNVALKLKEASVREVEFERLVDMLLVKKSQYTMEQLRNLQIQDKIYLLIEEINTKNIKNMVENEEILNTKELISWYTEEVAAKLESIIVDQEKIHSTNTLNLSMKGLRNTMIQMIVISYSAMGAFMLLSYGFMRGEEWARDLGAALAALAIGLTVVKHGSKLAAAWQKIYAIATGEATAAQIKQNIALYGGIGIIAVLVGLYMRYRKAAVVLIPAIYGVAVAMMVLNAQMKIFNALLAGLPLLIGLIVMHFVDLHDILIGNSVVPAFRAFIKVLGKLFSPFTMIIDLIKLFIDNIDFLEEKLSGLGEFIMELIGNSLIPEAFNSGVGRIIKDFDRMDERINEQKKTLEDYAKYSDRLMGHSIIPEAFERGIDRINRAFDDAPFFNYREDLGIADMNTTPTVNNARFSLDLSNFTTKREIEPDKLQELVQNGIEESLRKWDRKARR